MTLEEFYFLIEGAAAADVKWALRRFLRDDARIERFRRGHADASPDALIGQAISDFTFRAPGLQFAEWRAAQQTPTFLYDFC